MIRRNSFTISYSVFFYSMLFEKCGNAGGLHLMPLFLQLPGKLIDTQVRMMDQLYQNDNCLGIRRQLGRRGLRGKPVSLLPFVYFFVRAEVHDFFPVSFFYLN
jgi:hypothetical protein